MKEDLATYAALAPPSRVVRLALERDEDGLRVILVLRPEGERRLRQIVFTGVRDVCFPSGEAELLGVVELVIADISDRGWEWIRFHVQDREEELLAFFAVAYEESVIDGV